MLYQGDTRIHVCPTKNHPVFGPGSSFGKPLARFGRIGNLAYQRATVNVDCGYNGRRLGSLPFGVITFGRVLG
jgi:hypothetical protein